MRQRTGLRPVVRHLTEGDGDSSSWMAAIGKRNVQRLVNGCWQVGDDPGAYVRYANEYVHRLVYMTIRGPIPDGWNVHHRCENKACINPDHLEAVTPLEHKARHAELDASRSR